MQVIQHFLKNNLRNFNYIVLSDVNGEAIFFDPSDIEQTLPLCASNGGEPKYLINTHYHADHMKDNDKLLEQTQAKEVLLEHEDEFSLSDSEDLKCLFTPGHVMDHKCYLLREKGEEVGIICGDTIFNAGMGNCKNGGDVETLYQTFKNIIHPLSDHLKIYPSHDYFLNNLKFAESVEPDNQYIQEYIQKRESMDCDHEFMITTVGEERLYNPFFRAFQKDFQKKMNKNEKELFIYLRSLRDNW
ncbi:MAG: hypothetical protein CME62_11275 [Halobacteriovoraceae bacterium]|nr:hypothetical protein [Halobacteriovoraceae bacterium]|tara:strand:+ start:11698 stop:12429 length:732 start_codon:yes stop_codon:yes gene_type:complete